MNYKLVIVESPAKAKTIEKFLGRTFKVAASMGHLRDLPKSQLGVDLENDFEVKYITVRGKGPLVKDLKSLAKKAKKVYLATDPDREGEAIAWHLTKLLSLDETDETRVEFNEITKDTVKAAIKAPRKIDLDKVDAQQARRVLDRIVGYKLSPLLWSKIKKGLSAGRVQSVALKLICERDDEINSFEKKEYWSIESIFTSDGNQILGKLKKKDGKKIEINNEEEADLIIKEVSENKKIIESIKTSKKENNPKPPFTTSSLQQEAYQKINFTTKKTMMIAQQLYEGIKIGKDSVGLITYLRTDSVRISDDAKEEAKRFIENEYGQEYLLKKERAYKSKGKAQDAHEAIRPTSSFREPDEIKEYLSRDQYRLYNLIWQRFIASRMASAQIEVVKAEIKAGSYSFIAQGSKTLFKGYQEVYHLKESGDKTSDLIVDLKENQELEVMEIEKKQHFTQPPARYTEASLVKTLEEKGIGRPSTFSPTIMTILSRGYVVKEDKQFYPTELGGIVNELLESYFSDIIDYEFTAQLENNLDEVEEGNLYWKSVLKDFYSEFSQKLEHAEKEISKVEVKEEVSDVICEKCGRNMVVKIGRYGKFLACPGFPDCRNAKPLLEETGVACPICETGKVVIRRSKKGRTFYGCSNFPECEFINWNEPVDEKCPKCNSGLTRKKTKAGNKYNCINEECGYEFMREKEEEDE